MRANRKPFARKIILHVSGGIVPIQDILSLKSALLQGHIRGAGGMNGLLALQTDTLHNDWRPVMPQCQGLCVCQDFLFEVKQSRAKSILG